MWRALPSRSRRSELCEIPVSPGSASAPSITFQPLCARAESPPRRIARATGMEVEEANSRARMTPIDVDPAFPSAAWRCPALERCDPHARLAWS